MGHKSNFYDIDNEATEEVKEMRAMKWLRAGMKVLGYEKVEEVKGIATFRLDGSDSRQRIEVGPMDIRIDA